MKSNQQLIEEFLRDHQILKIPAKRHRSSPVQFQSRQQRGVRKRYNEVLKDHRDSFDPVEQKEESNENSI